MEIDNGHVIQVFYKFSKMYYSCGKFDTAIHKGRCQNQSHVARKANQEWATESESGLTHIHIVFTYLFCAYFETIFL